IIARVGNAGLADMAGTGVARFHLGDPANGGQLIGEAVVPALAAGAYADVSLSASAVLPGSTVYVMVEYADLVGECDLANNSHAHAVAAANQFADASVSVDKPVLGPNEDLLVTASIHNTGALDGSFTV